MYLDTTTQNAIQQINSPTNSSRTDRTQTHHPSPTSVLSLFVPISLAWPSSSLTSYIPTSPSAPRMPRVVVLLIGEIDHRTCRRDRDHGRY